MSLMVVCSDSLEPFSRWWHTSPARRSTATDPAAPQVCGTLTGRLLPRW